MGVGVYTSDFGSAGTTFIVTGPLATDEEYASYVAATEDPLGQSDWATQEYDDFTDNMAEVISEALKQVGFFPANHRRGYTRASFDDNFVSCSSNGLAEIGWRSWESDYVIAVAGDGRWQSAMADPGGYVEEFAAEQGLDPEKAKPVYLELVEALKEYVRLALQDNSFECRYRTSPYTTDQYPVNAETAPRMDELAGLITERTQFLAKRFGDRVPEMDRASRVEFAGIIDRDGLDITTEVAVIDHRTGHVRVSDGRRLQGQYEVQTQELASHLAALQKDDLAFSPVPLTAETAALFDEIRKDRAGYGILVVAPDEFYEAFDDDISVTYPDSSGDRLVITFENDRAAAPSAPAP